MSVLEIVKDSGLNRSKPRVGRGTGNGRGKTSTRGHKGQNSRSGGGVRPYFEGGQMPLYRRIPKRGFKNINKVYANLLNVSVLNAFSEGDVVDIKSLLEKGMIKNNGAPIKLLANGDLSVKGLKIKVDKASKAALEKVKKANGEVEIVSA